jgi:hypothetical protein
MNAPASACFFIPIEPVKFCLGTKKEPLRVGGGGLVRAGA